MTGLLHPSVHGRRRWRRRASRGSRRAARSALWSGRCQDAMTQGGGGAAEAVSGVSVMAEALMLVLQGATAAVSSLQVFLSEEAPEVKDKQLLIFAWCGSAASTCYGVTFYLISNLAEPDDHTDKDLESGSQENPPPTQGLPIPLWSLLPRILQCIFSLWAVFTMVQAPDYNTVDAFKFLVDANICLILWSCIVAVPSLYSGWCSFLLPSWVHTLIWFIDLVMLSIIFRAACGAGSIVVVIDYDLDECHVTHCRIFGKSSILTTVTYLIILLPTVWTKIKKIYA